MSHDHPQPVTASSRQDIALIGESQEQDAVSTLVPDNLLAGGFKGSLHIVNSRPVSRPDTTWVASVTDLPAAPELAIIMTPNTTMAGIIGELGASARAAP
ncbi:CoA-binding protein [Sphingobium arseniciresistens]|uniref:CoA-binding protein n=1 Tax=Sphingobium arseniciresistens TaxID=3030834 RepID=UPI0030CA418C